MNSGRFSFPRLMLAALSISLVALLIPGCDKNDKQAPPPTAPVVTTAAITNVNVSSGIATGGGSIVSDGGDTITQTGIVWSKTNAMPTLDDSAIAGTGNSGTFSVNISGLDFNNTYYFRAFATNSVGTGYGSVVTLTTSADSVKFVYNDEEVIYGVIVSQATGRKWLDRNLGAHRVATSIDDYLAYGDLFQWGRPADGHQLMNWTSSTEGSAVNGVATTPATSDIPGHSDYVSAVWGEPWALDWRADNNRNRWATNAQGPCPAGWHVPSKSEFLSELELCVPGSGQPCTPVPGSATSGGIKSGEQTFEKLKLTMAGARYADSQSTFAFGQVGLQGYYWSSSDMSGAEMGDGSWADEAVAGVDLTFSAGSLGGVGFDNAFKSSGMSLRCIKDL